MQLRKAERTRSKLRIGFSGPSGSGKTYSALILAKGLTDDWGKIALIDSENGSGELYSNLGGYNILTLDAPYSPERYIEAIKTCEDSGMEVIVIDSTSHEWDGKGGCLEINEKLAATKFKGNTWAAWSDTTPRHQKFIDSIVSSKCHIITTARSKTDTIQTEDKKIKKVGLKEIQREGFEYELTINFTLDRDSHFAIASKDRTSLFIDRDPFLISEDIGKEIIKWNQSGIDGKKRDEEEKKAKEKEKDIVYNAYCKDMQKVKTIADLKVVWDSIMKSKDKMSATQIDDLTTRKDAIKQEFSEIVSSDTPPTPNSKKYVQ